MRVRRIGRTAELEAFGQKWQALHRASAQRDNVFLTYEWLATWWRTMGEPCQRQLYVLVVESDEGHIVGIAPLVRQQQRLFPGVSLDKLLFMGRDVSDYLDLISCPGQERGVTEAVVRYLQEHRRDWDLLELTSLPESSSLLSSVREAFPGTYLVQAESYVLCPYIRLEGTWDDYLQSRKAKFRHNLRRRRRLFGNQPSGRLVVCEKPEQVERALERLFWLNSERQEAKGGVSNLADVRRQVFHREVARLFLSRGWLDCSYLEAEDRIVAVRYGYRYGRKFFGMNVGFDPQWASHGVGSVLTGYAVERAFEAGLEEFDMQQGDYAYKLDWATGSRQVHKLVVLTPQLKPRLWHRGREGWHRADDRFRRRLKAYLPEPLRLSLRRSLVRVRPLLKRLRP